MFHGDSAAWLGPTCADIRSAFMQGKEKPRDKELFTGEWVQGLPGHRPGQVVRVVEGVLGHVAAPKQW
eukprot:8820601-Pyramimonas_sp.AAC.1